MVPEEEQDSIQQENSTANILELVNPPKFVEEQACSSNIFMEMLETNRSSVRQKNKDNLIKYVTQPSMRVNY